MELAAVAASLILGVFLAYVLDSLELPPFLGFFISGFIIGKLLGVNLSYTYLQILLSLVAFEVGRQTGSAGLAPVSFFAVFLEASLIVGMSIVLFRLVGFTVAEALIVAVMMLSSSSLLTLRLSQTLPPHARGTAISLTTLEDAVLFISLSLLLGNVTVESLPVILTILVAMGLVAFAVFSYIYRYIIGREYALPFALATAFGFVSVVQYFQIASPFIGAFVAGYLFSRSDVHKVHEKEAAAVSGFVIYLYMLAVGLSLPALAFNPLYMTLGVAISFFAIAIRAVAVFFGSLLTTGQPKLSTGVALSAAHVSELSLSIPIIAHAASYLDIELATALALSPVFSLFLAPYMWRYRTDIENYVARRVRELPKIAVYEKLYHVVTHAFTTAAKIAILVLVLSFSIAYLGLFSIAVILPTIYFLYRYSSEIYRDLLIALGKFREARYVSVAVIMSTFSLAIYVSIALLVRLGELHLYVTALVMGVIIYLLFATFRELQRKSTREFNSRTTEL